MQYKTVAPVGDRVFVKIDKEEEKTTTGILLPTSAQKKPTQGQVVQAGEAKAIKVRAAKESSECRMHCAGGIQAYKLEETS